MERTILCGGLILTHAHIYRTLPGAFRSTPLTNSPNCKSFLQNNNQTNTNFNKLIDTHLPTPQLKVDTTSPTSPGASLWRVPVAQSPPPENPPGEELFELLLGALAAPHGAHLVLAAVHVEAFGLHEEEALPGCACPILTG